MSNTCSISDLVASVDCNIEKEVIASGELGKSIAHGDTGYAWMVRCERCGGEFDGSRCLDEALAHVNEVTAS